MKIEKKIDKISWKAQNNPNQTQLGKFSQRNWRKYKKAKEVER